MTCSFFRTAPFDLSAAPESRRSTTNLTCVAFVLFLYSRLFVRCPLLSLFSIFLWELHWAFPFPIPLSTQQVRTLTPLPLFHRLTSLFFLRIPSGPILFLVSFSPEPTLCLGPGGLRSSLSCYVSLFQSNRYKLAFFLCRKCGVSVLSFSRFCKTFCLFVFPFAFLIFRFPSNRPLLSFVLDFLFLHLITRAFVMVCKSHQFYASFPPDSFFFPPPFFFSLSSGFPLLFVPVTAGRDDDSLYQQCFSIEQNLSFSCVSLIPPMSLSLKALEVFPHLNPTNNEPPCLNQPSFLYYPLLSKSAAYTTCLDTFFPCWSPPSPILIADLPLLEAFSRPPDGLNPESRSDSFHQLI